MKNIILFLLFLITLNSYSKTNDSKENTKQIDYKLEFQKLNSKYDSLNRKIYEIEKNDYKSLEVVEQVDCFYDKSWNKLVTFLSIAGGIILFVLPYLLSKNQEREFESKKREFQDYTNSKLMELETKIAGFHTSQFELLKNEINSLNSDLNKNIKREIDQVHAMSFFMRGLIAGIKEQFNKQLVNYILAANKLIEINNEENLQSVLKSIKEVISTHKEKENKISESTLKRIEKLLEDVENNYTEMFNEIITNLREDLEAIRKS